MDLSNACLIHGTVFEKSSVGSEIEGEIKNITEFGLFIGLSGEIDGMAHFSDLDWERPGEEAINDYSKGENVKAKVLDIDPEKEEFLWGLNNLQKTLYHRCRHNSERHHSYNHRY